MISLEKLCSFIYKICTFKILFKWWSNILIMGFLLQLRNIFKANRTFHIVFFRILILFEWWTKRSSMIFSVIAPMFLLMYWYSSINRRNLIHFIKSFIYFFLLIVKLWIIYSTTIILWLEISLSWWLISFFGYMIGVQFILTFYRAV